MSSINSYRNFGILLQSPVIITAVSGYCGESLYGYEVVNLMAMRRPISYTFMFGAVKIKRYTKKLCSLIVDCDSGREV